MEKITMEILDYAFEKAESINNEELNKINNGKIYLSMNYAYGMDFVDIVDNSENDFYVIDFFNIEEFTDMNKKEIMDRIIHSICRHYSIY